MQRYCLDENVFIEAKNGPYRFSMAPGFWTWLDRQVFAGVVFSSAMVYEKLSEGGDELADWIVARKDAGLFFAPDMQVQKEFRLIADYVRQKYLHRQSEEFLGGSDPWVIAHAKAENAVVITSEVVVPLESRKVKIPNICKEFGVPYLSPYEAFQNLGLRLVLM